MLMKYVAPLLVASALALPNKPLKYSQKQLDLQQRAQNSLNIVDQVNIFESNFCNFLIANAFIRKYKDNFTQDQKDAFKLLKASGMNEYRKILKYSGKIDENTLEFGETFGEIVELFGEEFENYLGSDDQGEIPDGRSISNKPKKMKKKFYKLNRKENELKQSFSQDKIDLLNDLTKFSDDGSDFITAGAYISKHWKHFSDQQKADFKVLKTEGMKELKKVFKASDLLSERFAEFDSIFTDVADLLGDDFKFTVGLIEEEEEEEVVEEEQQQEEIVEPVTDNQVLVPDDNLEDFVDGQTPEVTSIPDHILEEYFNNNDDGPLDYKPALGDYNYANYYDSQGNPKTQQEHNCAHDDIQCLYDYLEANDYQAQDWSSIVREMPDPSYNVHDPIPKPDFCPADPERPEWSLPGYVEPEEEYKDAFTVLMESLEQAPPAEYVPLWSDGLNQPIYEGVSTLKCIALCEIEKNAGNYLAPYYDDYDGLDERQEALNDYYSQETVNRKAYKEKLIVLDGSYFNPSAKFYDKFEKKVKWPTCECPVYSGPYYTEMVRGRLNELYKVLQIMPEMQKCWTDLAFELGLDNLDRFDIKQIIMNAYDHLFDLPYDDKELTIMGLWKFSGPNWHEELLYLPNRFEIAAFKTNFGKVTSEKGQKLLKCGAVCAFEKQRDYYETAEDYLTLNQVKAYLPTLEDFDNHMAVIGDDLVAYKESLAVAFSTARTFECNCATYGDDISLFETTCDKIHVAIGYLSRNKQETGKSTLAEWDDLHQVLGLVDDLDNLGEVSQEQSRYDASWDRGYLDTVNELVKVAITYPGAPCDAECMLRNFGTAELADQAFNDAIGAGLDFIENRE